MITPSVQQNPRIQGETATFVWRGDQAPDLIGDFNNWDEANPVQLDQTAPGVWEAAAEFSPDAYIEYAFVSDQTRLYDPLNPNVIYNGVSADNHYFYMPAGGVTPLAQPRLGAPRGKMIHYELRNSFLLTGGRRSLDLYQPAAAGPLPLVLVFDGQDYWNRASLPVIVDNLIAAGRMRPVALALLENGGQARGIEYSCNDATVGVIVEEALPAAYEHLDLVDLDEQPGAFAVMGASMGGLIALYTALRAPELFGKVLSQSGAFFPESVVYPLLKQADPQQLKIWMDVGLYEFLLPANRQMQAELQAAGFDFHYREYAGGHNYSSWRDDLWRGLEVLFPAEI
ncbi:MAG TPA: alpha/beta hydrolase-fold protein [Anaerolineales bacterium]|nr:alpha/beta hydrolase-fold protein [Anaerolineales bacterium]